MKFAFLPNYFKKIGIIGFFVFFAMIITASIMAVVEAFPLLEHSTGQGAIEAFRMGQELGETFVSSNYWIIQICSILLLLSIAFYMLAKEKVDDEYMDAIRWESLRLSLIISIGITMLAILIHWNMSAKNILLVQFIIYLIVFRIKKSSSIENE